MAAVSSHDVECKRSVVAVQNKYIGIILQIINLFNLIHRECPINEGMELVDIHQGNKLVSSPLCLNFVQD